MKTEKWFKDLLKSFEKDFDFRLETIILKITESISKRMEEKNLSRSQLAKLLGVSPPAVTKVLNGTSNFTLKTLLSLADVLELELEIGFREKEAFPVRTTYESTISAGGFSGTEVNSGTIGLGPEEMHVTGTINPVFGEIPVSTYEIPPSKRARDLEEIGLRDAA